MTAFKVEEIAVFTLENILYTFTDPLTGYAAVMACLFAIMDERGWRRLKKLPILLPAPLTAPLLIMVL